MPDAPRPPDRMNRTQYRRPRQGRFCRKLALFAGVAVCVMMPAWSAQTDYAMLMPKAGSSLLLDIDAAGDRLVAVGERGHILYSDDQGSSWNQAKVPTSVMLTRVFFISETTGWVVGHDGNILLSTDGGIHWTLQRDGLSDQAVINEDRVGRAREEVRALEGRLATASEVMREDLEAMLEDARHDLEVAMEILEEPVYAPPLMDVWFADEEQGWAAGAFGSLLRTTNGGRSWIDCGYKVDNPEELHFNGVAADSDGTVYLVSEWGYVFQSASSGEVWHLVETGYDGSFFGVLVNPANQTVFAYGLLGNIYRSRDRGQTWDALDSAARDSLFGAAVTADGSLVFVGQNGAAVLTADDGETFVDLHPDSRRGLYGVAPGPGGAVMVTGEGGSSRLALAVERHR